MENSQSCGLKWFQKDLVEVKKKKNSPSNNIKEIQNIEYKKICNLLTFSLKTKLIRIFIYFSFPPFFLFSD